MSRTVPPQSLVPTTPLPNGGQPSLLRRIQPFALAVLLPVCAALLTGRLTFLHEVPFALFFFSVAFVAITAELAPTLLACLAAILAHVDLGGGRWLLTPPEVAGSALLVTLAVFLNRTDSRRRRSAQDLQAALVTLQDNTHLLIEAQQASKCASWTYDSQDKTRWQPGGFEVFGIPFSQLEQLGSPIELILPEDQPRVRDAVRRMVDHHTALLVEYRVLFPNGEMHWSEARGTPDPVHAHLWRGVTFDVTDRKLAEAALIRSEKLAAMGRLASTVAHEVNNPLEAVTNLLYLARTDEQLGPETRTYLATAEAELGRLANITRLTLGFVRTTAGRRQVEIASVLDDILAIFHHRCEMKAIHIERDYRPEVVTTIATHELRQIATNLISNAIDALPAHDGRIRVHIHHETCARAGARTAVLIVEDNGVGIPRENFTRIFEPFFTTKEDIGTGIGLWVTRELVEKNEGSISVDSGELGGGMKTRFRIELPAVPAPAMPAAAEVDAAAATAGVG